MTEDRSAPPESELWRIRGWSDIVRGTNLQDVGIFHPIRDYMDLLQPLRGILIGLILDGANTGTGCIGALAWQYSALDQHQYWPLSRTVRLASYMFLWSLDIVFEKESEIMQRMNVRVILRSGEGSSDLEYKWLDINLLSLENFDPRRGYLSRDLTLVLHQIMLDQRQATNSVSSLYFVNQILWEDVMDYQFDPPGLSNRNEHPIAVAYGKLVVRIHLDPPTHLKGLATTDISGDTPAGPLA
ncbi:uncharacterized protein HKW66_Vig0221410 [Vigna angularis]|uniref:Uncharacterized protein n=1 Tax=Phaseolus angularis TaxID=3914 RepID=A0A8T0K2X2_PHAAN|nr:uncharacterized protein HKW66_Vig0221410 [Vigna angularis]